MKYDEFMEKVISITRFSKKIYFIDPIIPYDLLPLNCENSKKEISLSLMLLLLKNNIHRMLRLWTKSSFIKKGEIYTFSLNKMIENIYQNNFFKMIFK